MTRRPHLDDRDPVEPERPGAWIREEFRRAAERTAALPRYARPTVTRPFAKRTEDES
jgi:hypothetical protein